MLLASFHQSLIHPFMKYVVHFYLYKHQYNYTSFVKLSIKYTKIRKGKALTDFYGNVQTVRHVNVPFLRLKSTVLVYLATLLSATLRYLHDGYRYGFASSADDDNTVTLSGRTSIKPPLTAT